MTGLIQFRTEDYLYNNGNYDRTNLVVTRRSGAERRTATLFILQTTRYCGVE